MDHELRRAMYIAAAIQGMMAAESPDVTMESAFVADRAVEIANNAISIETGEMVYESDEIGLVPQEVNDETPPTTD